MNLIHDHLLEVLKGPLKNRLKEEPRHAWDGLEVFLKEGTLLQTIYADRESYLFQWEKEGVLYRIDTAPCHRELKTFPNHFHQGEEVGDDLWTDTDKSPEENLKAVIEKIC